MKLRTLITGAASAVLGLVAVPIAMASAHSGGSPSNTIVVKPADLAVPTSTTTEVNSWYFYNDNTDTPSTAETANYTFVSGPATPPAGVGSLNFNLTDAGDRFTIATNKFAGDDLSTISKLKFDMYVPAASVGGTGTTIFLNFDIDFYNAVPAGYQGRLVYVPQDNGTVIANTWQTWDASSGLYGWSRFAKGVDNTASTPDDNMWPDGNTTALRSLADIKAAFPTAEIWNEGGFTGQLLIRAGHPGPSGMVNNVDKVVVNNTTYDFEPTVAPPTNKDQCKNDGWKTFNNPSFKNQEKCYDYVKSHGAPGEVKGTIRLSGPSQKVKFNIDDHDSWWHHNKKDTVEYWNFDYPENGGVLHYKADVLCVGGDKSTGEARVLYQIPDGHPGLSGLYIAMYVKEVKNGPDLNSQGVAVDLTTGTTWCNTGTGVSLTPYTVTKGHVEVD